MIRLVNRYAKTNIHEDDRICVNGQIRTSMNGRKHRICVSEQFIHNERIYAPNDFTNKNFMIIKRMDENEHIRKTNNHTSPNEYTYRTNGRKRTSMSKRTAMRNERIRIERVHDLGL
jgi:hypothetical protein